jgi:Flp pilus assembly protein protease CpaA
MRLDFGGVHIHLSIRVKIVISVSFIQYTWMYELQHIQVHISMINKMIALLLGLRIFLSTCLITLTITN